MKNLLRGSFLFVLVGGLVSTTTAPADGALVLSIDVGGVTMSSGFDTTLSNGLSAGHFNSGFGDILSFNAYGTYLGSSFGGYVPTGAEIFQVTLRTLDLVGSSTPYDSRLTLNATAAIAGTASVAPTVSITLSAAGQSVIPGYLNTAKYTFIASGNGSGAAPAPTLVSATYQDTNNTVTSTAVFSGSGSGAYTVTEPPAVILPSTMVPSNFSTSISFSETFVNGASQSVGFTAQADVITPEPGMLALWGLALTGVAGSGLRRRLGAALARFV